MNVFGHAQSRMNCEGRSHGENGVIVLEEEN